MVQGSLPRNYYSTSPRRWSCLVRNTARRHATGAAPLDFKRCARGPRRVVGERRSFFQPVPSLSLPSAGAGSARTTAPSPGRVPFLSVASGARSPQPPRASSAIPAPRSRRRTAAREDLSVSVVAFLASPSSPRPSGVKSARRPTDRDRGRGEGARGRARPGTQGRGRASNGERVS